MNPPLTTDPSEYQESDDVSTPFGPLLPWYRVPSDVVSLSQQLSVSKTCTVICTGCVKVMVQLSPFP